MPQTMPKTIEEQAKELAKANMEAEPGITAIYWFHHDEYVLLVEIMENIPLTVGEDIEPFIFPPSIEEDIDEAIFVDSQIALIRPDEFGKLKLPKEWGNWNDAVKLKERR